MPIIDNSVFIRNTNILLAALRVKNSKWPIPSKIEV